MSADPTHVVLDECGAEATVATQRTLAYPPLEDVLRKKPHENVSTLYWTLMGMGGEEEEEEMLMMR